MSFLKKKQRKWLIKHQGMIFLPLSLTLIDLVIKKDSSTIILDVVFGVFFGHFFIDKGVLLGVLDKINNKLLEWLE